MTYTITEMKAAQKENGLHWFSKPSMNFFNTKIETAAKDNHFITSEYMENVGNRKYTIRCFKPLKFAVDTIGDFQQYATLKEAKQALKNLMKVGV
jgi:hypothetical protein